MALSTYLPLLQTLHAEADAAAKDTSHFHGTRASDPVIPYAFGRASAEELLRQDYALEWHDYGMPHSVCPEEIRDIEQWLTQRLAE